MDKKNFEQFFDNVLASNKSSPKELDRINDDIVTNEDGYKVYWPMRGATGYLDEYFLVLIAAMLNKKNREWDHSIDEYFDGRLSDPPVEESGDTSADFNP